MAVNPGLGKEATTTNASGIKDVVLQQNAENSMDNQNNNAYLSLITIITIKKLLL